MGVLARPLEHAAEPVPPGLMCPSVRDLSLRKWICVPIVQNASMETLLDHYVLMAEPEWHVPLIKWTRSSFEQIHPPSQLLVGRAWDLTSLRQTASYSAKRIRVHPKSLWAQLNGVWAKSKARPDCLRPPRTYQNIHDWDFSSWVPYVVY